MDNRFATRHDASDNEGEIIMLDDGNAIGFLSYRKKDNMIYVEHVKVNDKYKGMGLGKVLLDEMVSFAVENDCKIVAVCAFVKHMFQRNEEYAFIRHE